MAQALGRRRRNMGERRRLSLAVGHPSLYGLLRTGFAAVCLVALGGFVLGGDAVGLRPSATR